MTNAPCTDSRSTTAARTRAAPAERLRIAVVRQEYRVDGGGERFVGNLVSLLRSQGHDVTLITRRWDGQSPGVLRCNPPKLGRVLRDWWFARAVDREIQRHRFDLVQSHERIPGCQIYRAGDGVHREWLHQRRRVLSPLARAWLDLSPYHAYLRRAERLMFESSRLRLVICNSRMVQEEIAANFAIDRKKLRLVYNSVDTERFHPRLRARREQVRRELGIPPEVPVFLYVGSGFHRKGAWSAVEALAEVPGAHLVIVGKDKAMDAFRRRAAGRGLGVRVHLLGVRPDVAPCYGMADALVLPTLYDPFPNVVLEAMASGLPVVTSTKCGGAELIREDQSGFVCDALDHAGLVRAMCRLTDRSLAERLGAEARRTVEPLTPAALHDQLLAIYREVLDDQK
jgi:UDP-glucose:(heptosyl)LPS alpha-1,3-glucosyltransferase